MKRYVFFSPSACRQVLGSWRVSCDFQRCSVVVQILYGCTSEVLVLVSLGPMGVTLNPVGSACTVEPSDQLCVSSHVSISVISLERKQVRLLCCFITRF